MATTVAGLKEFERTLDRLRKTGSKRAVSGGINAALTVTARAIRAEIGNVEVPPGTGMGSSELKREARKLVRKRFVRGGTNRMGKATTPVAKAGFGVGKKKKNQKAKGGGKSRGVGLSTSNIHWFVLGTEERYHKKSGQPDWKHSTVFRGSNPARDSFLDW